MVVVLDFSRTGHHESWSNAVVEWLSDARVPHRQLFIRERFLNQCSIRGKLMGPVVFWSRLQKKLCLKKDDVCLFMYWDYAVPFWLAYSQRSPLFPAKVAGIWMNTWDFRKKKGEFVRRVPWNTGKAFLSDSSLSLAVLDEQVAELLRKRRGAYVSWIPDFASAERVSPMFNDEMLTQIREFKGDRKLLLVVGAINGSKNIGLLSRLLVSPDIEDWVVAIVGECFLDLGVLKASFDSFPQVRIWDGRIPDERVYNSILIEANLLWAVYSDWRGSSNLVTKAGLLSIPIVVSRGYLLEERVRKFQIGFVVDDTDPSDLSELLLDWDARFLLISPNDSALRADFRLRFSLEHAAHQVADLLRRAHSITLPPGSVLGRTQVFARTAAQLLVDKAKSLLRK